MSNQITGTEVRERCFDALLRVNHIVHLDSMVADAIDSDVMEWVHQTSAVHVLAEVFGWDDAGDMDEEDIEEALMEAGARGWLVEVSTPERDRWPLFSWGLTTFQVFYGETYAAALEKGFAWVAAMKQDRYERGSGSQVVPPESGTV